MAPGSVYLSNALNSLSIFIIIALLSRAVDEATMAKFNFYFIAFSFGLAFDLGISIFIPRAILARKTVDASFDPYYYFYFSLFFLLSAYSITFFLLVNYLQASAAMSLTEVFLLFSTSYLLVANNIARLIAYSLNSYLMPSLISIICLCLRLFCLALATQAADITGIMVLGIFWLTACAQQIAMHKHLVSPFKVDQKQQKQFFSEFKSHLIGYAQHIGSAWKLTLAAAAGAIATQLDKAVIALSFGVAAVAPVYYVTTLSMTGLSLLTLPLYQYFQPHITRALLASDDFLLRYILMRFGILILLIAVIFVSITFLARGAIFQLWLGDQGLGEEAKLLLPFIQIGSFFAMISVVPYSILVASGDYLFLCIASVCLTALFISILWLAVASASIVNCCLVISGYHLSSFLVSTARASKHIRVRNGNND